MTFMRKHRHRRKQRATGLGPRLVFGPADRRNLELVASEGVDAG